MLSLTLLLTRTEECLAEADPASAAAAEALYADARRLMESGDFASACPKLAESQRLDPVTGTLLNLASYYEQGGKKASAWLTWLEAARSAKAQGQADCEVLARDKARVLEGILGRVAIQVAPDAPPEITVKRDGELLTRAAFGTALPLDAGAHTLVASAPGYEDYRQTFVVTDGATLTLTVPALTRVSTAAPTDPETAQPQPEKAASAPPPEPSGASSTQRTVGWILGGVGLAGLGVGSVFGLLALNANNQSKENCVTDLTPDICSQEGLDQRNQAFGLATGSTVAFVAGTALMTGGVVLLLTAPDDKAESALQAEFRPMAGGGKFALTGSF